MITEVFCLYPKNCYVSAQSTVPSPLNVETRKKATGVTILKRPLSTLPGCKGSYGEDESAAI